MIVQHGIVDPVLLQEEPDDGAPSLGRSNVKWSIAVLVPSVDVDKPRAIRQDVFNNVGFGTLNGEVEDRGVI